MFVLSEYIYFFWSYFIFIEPFWIKQMKKKSNRKKTCHLFIYYRASLCSIHLFVMFLQTIVLKIFYKHKTKNIYSDSARQSTTWYKNQNKKSNKNSKFSKILLFSHFFSCIVRTKTRNNENRLFYFIGIRSK